MRQVSRVSSSLTFTYTLTIWHQNWNVWTWISFVVIIIFTLLNIELKLRAGMKWKNTFFFTLPLFVKRKLSLFNFSWLIFSLKKENWKCHFTFTFNHRRMRVAQIHNIFSHILFHFNTHSQNILLFVFINY